MTTDGWCPFADHRPVEKRWPGNKGRLAVVDHIAAGSYQGTISWFTGDSETSSHFLLGPDEELTQFVSIHDSAWTNGLGYKTGRWVDPQGRVVNPTWEQLRPGKPGQGINPNWLTITIERAGFPDTPWSEGQLATHTRLLSWIGEKYPSLLPYQAGVTLIGHRDISPIQKTNCPGPATDLRALARLANDQSVVPPVWNEYSDTSPILGHAQATREQAIRYITSRSGGYGEYTPRDIETIVGSYEIWGKKGGVDWILALCQNLKETGNFTSWWSQRPRRNPAGIGVTGEPGKGVWFPTWADDAIPAHIGRLLGYRFREGKETMTAQQQALIALAMHWRKLPSHLRGCATTYADLNGKWNAEKTSYARDIAAIANRIRKMPA